MGPNRVVVKELLPSSAPIDSSCLSEYLHPSYLVWEVLDLLVHANQKSITVSKHPLLVSTIFYLLLTSPNVPVTKEKNVFPPTET